MMTAPDDRGTITGTCACGATTSRPAAAPGHLAERINALPHTCASCADAQERALEAREAAERAHDAARRHAQRIASSAIPDGRLRLELGDLEHDAGRRAAINDARRWAEGSLLGLALVGPYGVGKTQIAAAAAAARLHGTSEVIWYRAGDLVDHLTRGFDSAERAHAQHAIDSRAPLVLDDLDKTRPSEHAAEQLFRAIDSCDAHGRQLIVTSNLKPGELVATWPARYGNAIASRLIGHCAVHQVNGRDRRLQP